MRVGRVIIICIISINMYSLYENVMLSFSNLNSMIHIVVLLTTSIILPNTFTKDTRISMLISGLLLGIIISLW